MGIVYNLQRQILRKNSVMSFISLYESRRLALTSDCQINPADFEDCMGFVSINLMLKTTPNPPEIFSANT